jgi:hypothetical protein
MQSIQEQRTNYCNNIHTLTEAIVDADGILAKWTVDPLIIKERVFRLLDGQMRLDSLRSLDDLRKYANGVNYFEKTYGHESPRHQAWKLFQFRPERFVGNISIDWKGIVWIVEFSHPEDMLYARFSQRREHFSQSDQGAWFFRVTTVDNHQIPICSVINGHDVTGTKIHELTHLRNNIIGMNHYARWGGRDVYEVYTYDDLQDEILAFFSEWYKRSQVQMTLLHDMRYHFYRRMEWWWQREQERFSRDVPRFINIASEVKKIRGFRFMIDLAIIPLHQWGRYLRYLKESGQSV